MHRTTPLELALSGALLLVAGTALVAAFGAQGDSAAAAAANLPHHLTLAELSADSGTATQLLPPPSPTTVPPTIPAVVTPPVSTPVPPYVPPYNYGYP